MYVSRFNPTVVRLKVLRYGCGCSGDHRCFNPTVVRLKAEGRGGRTLKACGCFNPTVVRLKGVGAGTMPPPPLEFQSHCGAIKSPYLHPTAFRRFLMFQSHCGAIKRQTGIGNAPRLTYSFNPTVVRLKGARPS